ncbi:MAG: division/cell wall cluster transcriptional repressor MraZ [Methylohalobius sp.]|nr:division/cell wall cluster transcriptional repressor MraZ [Methylohalobius sp.]
MFRGIHVLNLDAKGRLAIPTKYREVLQHERDGQVVITIAIDNRCLWLYALSRWEVLERQLLSLPAIDQQTRRLQRMLIGHASECQMDGQGRVLLPSPLRKYANLDRAVALVGLGGKFEIWDAQSWDIRRNVWVEETSLADSQGSSALSTLSI